MSEGREPEESNFNVCFLTVDGKPLTVIGSADAIDALEEKLQEAPAVELRRSLPPQ